MRFVIAAASALGLSAGPAIAANWSYAGDTGPDHWGALSADYAACALGEQQSPIDLSAAVPGEIAPPTLAWTPPAAATVVNDGRTIVVNLEGAGGLTHGATPFALKHFLVRHRSEHTIEGERFPLELHFIHQAENGALAVVGVMVKEGRENSTLAPVWEAAPRDEGSAALPRQITPTDLLPRNDAAFHYAGSLTAPPCTENVTWTVMAQPIEASAAQIAAFAELFPLNHRPLQPRNRRFVLKNR